MIRMKDMSKLTIVLITLVLILGLSGCGSGKVEEKDMIGYEIVNIKNGSDTWSVRWYNDDKDMTSKLAIYYNNKLKETRDNTDYLSNEAITLPKNNDINDLEGAGLITHSTYKASLDESVAYINYLENNGYTKIFEARTYKFVEIYMKNESTNNIKRLIITENYLVNYDVDEVKFNGINDYLFK